MTVLSLISVVVSLVRISSQGQVYRNPWLNTLWIWRQVATCGVGTLFVTFSIAYDFYRNQRIAADSLIQVIQGPITNLRLSPDSGDIPNQFVVGGMQFQTQRINGVPGVKRKPPDRRSDL